MSCVPSAIAARSADDWMSKSGISGCPNGSDGGAASASTQSSAASWVLKCSQIHDSTTSRYSFGGSWSRSWPVLIVYEPLMRARARPVAAALKMRAATQ